MNRSDTWDFCAPEYGNTPEKVTSPCIVKLLEQTSVLPVNSAARPIKVIDLAAGPGILSILLGIAYSEAECLEKMTVLSTDFSPKMVEMAEHRFASHNWSPPQFSVRTLDATNLVAVPSEHYTHAFCSFGIMMMPDALKALQEMFRVLAPSGTVGITTWHKVGWLPIFAECIARAKSPSSTEKEKTTSHSPFAHRWSDTSYLRKVLEDTGFQNVQVTIFESRMSLASQDDFIEKVLQSRWIRPIIKDANLTDEEREKYDQVGPQVLLDMVGKEPNQPFHLPMIAILAHGQKPVT